MQNGGIETGRAQIFRWESPPSMYDQDEGGG